MLIKALASTTIERREDIDGWKYFMNDGIWTMIRASGTEPVLRVYAQQRQSSCN